MDTLQIRNMVSDDLELLNDELEKNFDNFWTYGILKTEFDNINTKYIVAIQSNEIVGFAGILINYDTAEIMNIVVRKNKRSMGIGKKLLEHLILCSKEQKCTNITLEVNEINQPAINLYEKYNFEVVGKRKKYYNNEHDAILMTKNI